MKDVISIIDRQRLKEKLKEQRRLDGRKFDELREIEIKTGIIKNADGSAYVRLGDTEVIAGVKAEIVSPFPDMPDLGALSVNVEITPLSSPEVEIGPPSETAIEISRVIDRSIRESHAIDLSSLCIIAGKKVWGIFIDIYVISEGGNIMDAAGIAALAALKTTKIPLYRVENEEVIKLSEKKPLELHDEPVLMTFVKIGDYIVVDPEKTEENVCDAWITIATGKEGHIVGIQKGGYGTFKKEEIIECAKKSIELGKRVRKKIDEVIAGGEKD